MKRILLTVLIIAVTGIAYSQQSGNTISGERLSLNNVTRGYTPADINAEGSGIVPVLLLLSPLNPMLVVENEKAYFALTKEAALGFPFIQLGPKKGTIGKIGFEYSYVFRSERSDHLRAFFDFCYPLEAGDFAAVLISVGGGYFTDTKKAGLFPQVSMGILAPFSKGFALDLYIKGRETFMLKKEESNIFDLSMGVGLVFYPW
jgi:hypothetical protein